jgi:hypothetical protein
MSVAATPLKVFALVTGSFAGQQYTAPLSGNLSEFLNSVFGSKSSRQLLVSAKRTPLTRHYVCWFCHPSVASFTPPL